MPDTPHGPCPVVPRRAGQLTCTLHRGHGQASHAITRWNAPASLVPPPVPILTCHRSSLVCAGLWPPRDRARPVGHAVVAQQGVHRVASPCTALLVAYSSVPDVLASRAFPFQPRSGTVGSGRGGCPVGAALTRCGGTVVAPFTGGAWPVQVGSPKFFLAKVVIWPCRVPIPTRHPTAVWAITVDTDVQPETLACLQYRPFHLDEDKPHQRDAVRQ